MGSPLVAHTGAESYFPTTVRQASCGRGLSWAGSFCMLKAGYQRTPEPLCVWVCLNQLLRYNSYTT